MLYLNPETQNPHHEVGMSQIAKDAALVKNVMQCMETNPFSTADQEHLVNTFTGQVANDEVQNHLTAVKETGQATLQRYIKED